MGEWGKDRASGARCLEGAGLGKMGGGALARARTPCDQAGRCIWLLVVGPELEAEARIREASYSASPSRSEQLLSGVTVWFPGLVTRGSRA